MRIDTPGQQIDHGLGRAFVWNLAQLDAGPRGEQFRTKPREARFAFRRI
jgi:hypothetical protein